MKIALISNEKIESRKERFKHLVKQLAPKIAIENEVHVYCNDLKLISEFKNDLIEDVIVHESTLNRKWNLNLFLDSFNYLSAFLKADVLIVYGFSGVLLLPLKKLFPNKKVISNFECIEFKSQNFSKPKKWMHQLLKKIAVKYSDVRIADNLKVQEHIMKKYGLEVELIEYGSEHVKHVLPTLLDFMNYPFLKLPYAFCNGAMETENSLQLILEAFTKLSMPLIVIGNWIENEYAHRLVKQFSICDNIHLISVSDKKQIEIIRSNAYLYVHCANNGSTDLNLIEAMHLNLPVIAFNSIFNVAATENSAFYFSDAQTLVHLIENTNEADIQNNKANMYSISIRRYNWSKMAKKMSRFFEVQANENLFQLEVDLDWESTRNSAA